MVQRFRPAISQTAVATLLGYGLLLALLTVVLFGGAWLSFAVLS